MPSIAVVQHEPVYIAVVYISLTFYSAGEHCSSSFLPVLSKRLLNTPFNTGADTVLVSHALEGDEVEEVVGDMGFSESGT